MGKLVKVQTAFSYFDPLQKKIEEAERIIDEAYIKHNGKLFISFSGGKDSTILRHITKRKYPDIKVVFSNTTNELPEILRYLKQFPDTIVVDPDMTFKQVIERKGFPLISKEISQKANQLKNSGGRKTQLLRYYGSVKGNGILSKKYRFLASQKFNVTAECCQILKKDPLEKWAKKEDLKPLIALMADESMLRQQLSLYGENTDKKIYPFLTTNWSESDIWEYAKRYKIRFAECYYDQYKNGVLIPAVKRSGCRDCDFGSHLMEEDKFERSRLAYPKSLAKVMNYKNNGVTFEEARRIAHSTPKYDLGLYGGSVTKMEIVNDVEVYYYKLDTYDKACSCCGKRQAKRDISLHSTFIDTPNLITGRKRVIRCSFYMNKCNHCGMSGKLNDLHFFDMRYFVTKRVVDYVYESLEKKSFEEVSADIGLPIEDVFEIVVFDYNKPIMEAKKNGYSKIWFDENNNLIKSA
jgi:3'-phosphoadenosine 5'-phosphosulfate sulfotransferase (PAPS reductase)/FAD synthetase